MSLDHHVVDGGHPELGNGVPPTTLEITLPNEDLLPAIAQRTLASGARLYALTPRRASLEQIFLDIVGTEDSGQ
jgi:ABC-2 type transport system ATP-binding protein